MKYDLRVAAAHEVLLAFGDTRAPTNRSNKIDKNACVVHASVNLVVSCTVT